MAARLDPGVFAVAHAHYGAILHPGGDLQLSLRETIVRNRQAVVPSAHERAAHAECRMPRRVGRTQHTCVRVAHCCQSSFPATRKTISSTLR